MTRPPLGRSAPGGRFFPARMPGGHQVLVQTLPLRVADGAAERAERDRFERAISLATLEAAAAGDPILGHRALGGDEDRALVWLLPFVDLARPKTRNVRELLDLGVGIAAQLAERHARGRTAPLLSEQTVTKLGRIAGAQVFAAGPWLADEVSPIRFAPEERIAERALPTGDVWRLGQMLSELARDFALPPEVSRLTHADPVQRPTASEALEQLDAAFRGRRGHITQPVPLRPIDEVTTTGEHELDFDEPLLVPRPTRWIAPASLAAAGLFAGALLSLFAPS